MNELSELLRSATSAVDATYFHLSVDGGDPIFRERVYCYELYHQMRTRWPTHLRYVLNGELDKRAHPILRNLGVDHVTPDFLVHTPGEMEGNCAIIEVKHSTVLGGVRKDLETLDLFMRRVGYKRAIYLLYGREATPEGLARIEAVATEFPVLAPVEVWLHSEVNKPAVHASTLRGTGSQLAATSGPFMNRIEQSDS